MTIKSTDFEAELAYAENGNYKRQAEFSPVTKSAPAQQSKYTDFRNQLTFLTKSIKKSADPDQSMAPQMDNEIAEEPMAEEAAADTDVDSTALIQQLMGVLEDPNSTPDEIEALIQQLIDSGVITQEELDQILQEADSEEAPAAEGIDTEMTDAAPAAGAGRPAAPSGDDNSAIPDFNSL